MGQAILELWRYRVSEAALKEVALVHPKLRETIFVLAFEKIASKAMVLVCRGRY